jgi:cytochrome c-type biogenesis protein CcmH
MSGAIRLGGRLRLGVLVATLSILLQWVALPAFAIDPTELADPQLQQRYRALSQELRCMQCQNQSIADSPVGLAGDLRREVRELLEAGKSDAEIREHMRARYGDFILFRPRWTPQNAWLWLTPLVLLLTGLWVALRVIRHKAAQVDQDDGDSAGSDR